MKPIRLLAPIAAFVLALAASSSAQDSLNVTKISRYSNDWGLTGKCAYFGTHVCVPTNETGLRLVDISDIHRPREEGAIVPAGTSLSADIQGTTCYLANKVYGLRLIDVSDPGRPTLLSTYQAPTRIQASVTRGTLCYVAAFTSGLRILDISDSTAPRELGFWDSDGQTLNLAVSGNFCYLADLGIRVIDVTDSTDPRQVAHVQTPGAGKDIAIEGNYAYLADGVYGLEIFDITEPYHPTLVGSYNTPGTSLGVAVYNQHCYVADYNGGLRVIWVANPEAPREVGRYVTGGLSNAVTAMGTTAILSDGFNLYMMDCSAALEVPTVGTPLLPGQFKILSAYPNPFNGQTRVSYDLAGAGWASLGVYGMDGRLVSELARGRVSEGEHSVVWNAGGIPSGEFMVRLRTESGSDSKMVQLVK